MAVHGYVERCANFTHAILAEPPETLHKDAKRDALNRVEVDRGPARNWIAALLQYHLAGQAADRGGARCDQRAVQPWDGCVTREHDHRAVGRHPAVRTTTSLRVRAVRSRARCCGRLAKRRKIAPGVGFLGRVSVVGCVGGVDLGATMPVENSSKRLI